MSFFILDREKCRRDGICSRVCIAGIIKNDDDRYPYVDPSKNDYCIACGLCTAFCPTEACSTQKLDEKQFAFFDGLGLPSPEAADLLLKSRRSVRNYKTDPVDVVSMEKIFDAVRYAPSAKNMQPVRWVVTSSREETDRIRELTRRFYDEASRRAAPEDATVMKTLVRVYNMGKDIFLRGAPQIAVAVIPKDYKWPEDAATAIAYFELASYAHGLGTCWAGFLTTAARNFPPLREALGISEDEYFGGAAMFGYPVYRPRTVPSRKEACVTWI